MTAFPSLSPKPAENMPLNNPSDSSYNACYNRTNEAVYTGLFLLLAAILGVEIVITTALLYGFNRELNTAGESLHHEVFPPECLHHRPAAMHGADLASCDLLRRELVNSMNTTLLPEVRNSLWKSLGEHNITQVFKPAIHVGVKQGQFRRLWRTAQGDPQDSRFTSECLNWEFVGGQSSQMILSPDGEIVVPQNGIYFIYSQVNFVSSSPRPDLHYVLRKTATGLHPDSESGVVRLPGHQGALFQLEKGDRLSLCLSNMDAVLFQPEATYFGAYMID